ncbi:hypothetical protein GE061_019047 [Apolygus lucorum]|uniref:Uncharacterized protein n=1 Tax=Apolygus lucorum TaxID=248454 RepID=A0A8S9X7F2_APOLU|nr:hypothetical protein GE061_019047 [Apolygus lucorum]
MDMLRALKTLGIEPKDFARYQTVKEKLDYASKVLGSVYDDIGDSRTPLLRVLAEFSNKGYFANKYIWDYVDQTSEAKSQDQFDRMLGYILTYKNKTNDPAAQLFSPLTGRYLIKPSEYAAGRTVINNVKINERNCHDVIDKSEFMKLLKSLFPGIARADVGTETKIMLAQAATVVDLFYIGPYVNITSPALVKRNAANYMFDIIPSVYD